MSQSQDAEIIVAGSGLAGSTVLRHLLSHPSTKQKEIIVVDRDHAPNNEKTWCFWSNEDDFTEALVAHRWGWITVADSTGVYRHKLEHHRYKCIRSEDYLKACSVVIDSHPNVRRVQADVVGFYTDGSKPVVKTSTGELRSTLVLQSIFKPERIARQRTPIVLLQHFLGWEIETTRDAFDPEVAMFMDFRTDQKHGFAFVYVLPYSRRHALIEYTLFTPTTLPIEEYESALRVYVGDVLKISASDWNIKRTEYGVIPMEDTRYDPWYLHGILNMGMNGGQSKPSTGFTFSRVQHYALEVAKSIAKRSMQDLSQQSSSRFMKYDRLILWLLKENPSVVPGIFVRLFNKNGADRMFQFLDERTHLGQELAVMASTQWRHFFRAIWHSIIRK
jgi:lycopene beta-cyclase